MTVCSGEKVFVAVDGDTIEGATLDLGAAGVEEGSAICGCAEGIVAGAAFGCAAGGAVREADGGAVGAKRRVNGSRRRRGAGLEIAGATGELG